ncbi:hypothetical protein L3V82_10400 [Thiotrichales bacterium 19S3-7]|nr:hypothetical protein [Thiotrichales bacterium 19S3-7]MCF6802567.1 hypothetical protein [Thiotrichales bacterium 19S3-11]
MNKLSWFLSSIVVLSINGCGMFLPRPITVGHIPPSLTQPRVVYGCSSIETELKLATCYLKTSEALYLANQDKQSLITLESQWHN